MKRRCSNLDEEMLGISEPIQHLFSSLESPPRYSVMDAMADIMCYFLSKDVDFNGEELEGVLSSCEEHSIDRKKYGEESTNLSQSELMILSLYLAEFSRADRSFCEMVNRSLCRNVHEEIKPFARVIWLLLHAIRKCPPFEGRKLYRGANVHLRGYVQGRKITWRQFSSCSCHLRAQEEFVGVSGERTIVHVELVTNRARRVGQFSMRPNDIEVVLPPNTRLEVITTVDFEDGLRVIHLKELPLASPILAFDISGPTDQSLAKPDSTEELIPDDEGFFDCGSHFSDVYDGSELQFGNIYSPDTLAVDGAPPSESERQKFRELDNVNRAISGELPQLSSPSAVATTLAHARVALQSQAESQREWGLKLALHACDALHALVWGHALNQAALGSAGACSSLAAILRFATLGAKSSLSSSSSSSALSSSIIAPSITAPVHVALLEKSLKALLVLCRHGPGRETTNTDNIKLLGEAGACQGNVTTSRDFFFSYIKMVRCGEFVVPP